MGNEICCSRDYSIDNTMNCHKEHNDDLEPFASKIQNSFRQFKAKKSLQKNASVHQKDFEAKITSYGCFITENEMKQSMNPIIAQILSLHQDQCQCNQLEINDDPLYKYTFSQPPIKFKDGTIYHGHWNYNNKKEGYGVNICSDGSLYKGYWKDDKIQRKGLFVDVKGNWYEGELEDGLANGKGKLTIKDKFVYTGEFRNDLQNGVGKEENFIDNTIYEGDFVNGIKEGKGKLTFSDGTTYRGMFKEGKFNGLGVMGFKDGRLYTGQFKDNKMHGEGEFVWEDGKLFKGTYQNDLKNGYGTYYWNTDKYYAGYWMNNKQHGEGTYYKNGSEVKGVFRYGKIIMKRDATEKSTQL